MAYFCNYVKNGSSYASYVDGMFVTLSGAGWELHDEVSTTNKVFKSKGENGDYCYGYMQASLESTNYLVMRMFQDWNNSTHVGIAGTYYNLAAARVFLGLQKPVIMYSDKDFLLVWSAHTHPTAACVNLAGILSNVYDTTLTTTTSGVSPGASVTIPVMSSDGFLKGAEYKIVGTNFEGREVVTVSSITDSTNLVVSSLTYNYSSGAYIGREPCPIYTLYITSGPIIYYGFGYNSTYSTEGTGNQTSANARLTCLDIIVASCLDPEPSYSLYGLCPRSFVEYNSYSYVGYFGNIFNPPAALVSFTAYDGIYMNGDLYTIKAQPIATVVSGSANTVTLSAVSWDVNELQDKIIIIAIGNSAGHTRKIASNTSDTVTVFTDWEIDIDIDDSAIICDEVYRPISSSCVKEII